METETKVIRQEKTERRKVNITPRCHNQFCSSLDINANLFRFILLQPERVDNVTKVINGYVYRKRLKNSIQDFKFMFVILSYLVSTIDLKDFQT